MNKIIVLGRSSIIIRKGLAFFQQQLKSLGAFVLRKQKARFQKYLTLIQKLFRLNPLSFIYQLQRIKKYSSQLIWKVLKGKPFRLKQGKAKQEN